MKTRCTIATISYNTPEFLDMKLRELYDNHTISAYFWIRHLAEEDEKKDHIHLFIKPNKTIDTMDLQKEFEEIDSLHDEPLKCIDFVNSKIDHAVLYFAHWKPYLQYIHQSRRYHYDWDCFHYSDEDWFCDIVYNAMHFSAFAEHNRLLSAINDNQFTLSELISTGTVPLNLASQVYAYSSLLDQDRVERGKRKTHTPKYGENGLQVTKDGIVGGGGVLIDKQ